MTAPVRSNRVAPVGEHAARAVKAAKLARVLVDHGATRAADVEALPLPGRRIAETLAGVRAGSAETWTLVGVLVPAFAATTEADIFGRL